MIERLLAMLIGDLKDPEAVEEISSGNWKLYLDDQVDIEISCDSSSIFLSSYVGKIEKNRVIITEILSGNCLGLGTLGNVLCANDNNEIYIKKQEKNSITYRDFFSRVENIAAASVFWRKKINKTN